MYNSRHPLSTIVVLAFHLLLTLGGSVLAQGPLTPPGPPAPTFKTLQQVEPRTPISSLPATITAPGSYYLITNLTCLTCTNGGNGITVAANGVTLDLMGFELVGVAGAGSGVLVSGNRTNLAVRNGTVRAWGDHGVGASTAVNSQFAQLRASGNIVFGLTTGPYSRISDCSAFGNNEGIVSAAGAVLTGCMATSNANPGIDVGPGSTISGCTVTGNYGGITAGDGSSIIGCNARQNFYDGISVGAGCTVKDCTARLNTLNGIVTGAGCTVKDCTATTNSVNGIVVGDGSQVHGCTASYNINDGIQATAHCTVQGNHCADNSDIFFGIGIHTTGRFNMIDGNTTVRNFHAGLQVDGTDNVIVRNNFLLNNSSIGNSNAAGPLIDLGIGSFTITNANPWVNFRR